MEWDITRNTFLVDTPNLLFHRKDRGEIQKQYNMIALIQLIFAPIILIALITPKMLKECKKETIILENLIKSHGGKVVYSNWRDPDEVLLELALLNKHPIITNDKYREKKYDMYKKIKQLSVRFNITEQGFVPKKQYWLNQLGI